MPLKTAEIKLMECLAYQPHLLPAGDSAAIRHRDASRFLAPMLKRKQPEKRSTCRFFAGSKYTYNATGFPGWVHHTPSL